MFYVIIVLCASNLITAIAAIRMSIKEEIAKENAAYWKSRWIESQDRLDLYLYN